MTKVKKLTLEDADFPERLRNIANPPKQLYVMGYTSILFAKPCLSVVGSRSVSTYGRQVTTSLVEGVAGSGVVIISGLAIGVDSIAHRAALNAKTGTIAVLPCGLNRLYPSSNADLGRKILREGGALISEYPDNTPPLRQHFIARNRLVSGLSNAVLITEAAAKSGTLHTANFALEQGKTVMAVPGNITSMLSAGTNNLIKTGAITVTCADDILLALGITEKQKRLSNVISSNKEESVILSIISKGVSDGGEILNLSGLSVTVFNQTLTMLEIEGKILPLGAGHWGLK